MTGSRESKGELFSVHYTLRLPDDLIIELGKDAPRPVGEDDDRWMLAVAEAVQDRLPDLLTYAVDDPEVEW